MQRPLMFADELKSMPRGSFVVMKTGSHPMRVRLKLFFQWGIQFGEPLVMAKQDTRPVNYASREDLVEAILKKHPLLFSAPPIPEKLPDEEAPKKQPEKKKGTEKLKNEKKEQTSQAEKSVLNTKKRTEDTNEESDSPVQDGSAT